MSSTHKNLRQSLSSGSTSMFKNAFSISATIPILVSLNLNDMSHNKGVSGGPTWRQSFKDVPDLPSFVEASYTTRSFVVSASC